MIAVPAILGAAGGRDRERVLRLLAILGWCTGFGQPRRSCSRSSSRRWWGARLVPATARPRVPDPRPSRRSALTSPTNPTTSAPAPATTASTLDCGDYIATVAPAAIAPLQVVLGVVALPTSPHNPALQTALTGEAGPYRLFAKTGLLIKPGATFQLLVPTEDADRVGIGWGNGPITPSNSLSAANCGDPGDTQWLAYPGGYWIDHPACVPLIVTAGGKQQQVHIGLGTNCPGQTPPAEPNQT